MAQTGPMQPDIPQKFTPPMGEWDYLRREAMVPMRDGVKLFTVILVVAALPMGDDVLAPEGYIRVVADH